MKTFRLINLFSICILVLVTISCAKEDRDIDYLDDIQLPSNIALEVQLAQDNSGMATLTPSGDSASNFTLDLGDGSEAVEVQPGSSIIHTYGEGSFSVVVTASNINGETAVFTQAVVVSFLPPENLEVTINPVSGDALSIEVSATADLAVGFEVYFGDAIDENPTPLMVDEMVAHTYDEVGSYDVRVVALGGGSETIEVTQTVVIVNPVSLPIDFESSTIDYVFLDFGGALNAVIDNPDPTGENTSSKVVEFFKEPGAEVFAGTVIELGAPIDFSVLEGFTMSSWSPQAGLTVKLKLENAADPNISAEVDAVSSVSNAWETLSFDFASADLTQEYSKVIVFFDFGNPGTGTTFYYDNIEQSVSSGSPLVLLPIDFESEELNYDILGFEGADSSIIDNPDASGINTSGKVVQTIKTVGAQFFAGTIVPLDVPIDFSNTERIAIKTWSPKNDIPVRLKLETADGSQFVELDVNTTTTNEWEELVWDFSGTTDGIEFTKVIIFFEFVVDLAGDGATYYFDDIQLDN